MIQLGQLEKGNDIHRHPPLKGKRRKLGVKLTETIGRNAEQPCFQTAGVTCSLVSIHHLISTFTLKWKEA